MLTHLWIARRMRLGAEGTTAGTVIAVTGVALALTVMELTLGIVVGFKDEIKRKLMGFDAQISIEAAYDPYTRTQETALTVPPELTDIIEETVPGAEQRLTLRLPGILKTDDNFEGLVMIGQSPGADFTFERGNIAEGVWPDYSNDSCRNDIVISRATASALGLGTGDRVFSTFIIDGAVKMRRSTVAGIYEADFGEYDRTVAYASLAELQRIAGLTPEQGSRLDIRGIDEETIAPAAKEIEASMLRALGDGTLEAYYPVTTIEQSGALYFNWLSLLDTNVAVIFCLMLCVASFTLVSSLFILVLDNVPAIGILRSLGASRTFIRKIFVDLGMRIVLRGMAAGNIIGLGLLLLQKYTHIIPLDPEAYYLNTVPVEIRPWAFAALNIGVAAAAWLVLWIPARTASSVDPAKTINFE